jgi:ABC-type glycerol-3-phosphate transport system substrate-binding protein
MLPLVVAKKKTVSSFLALLKGPVLKGPVAILAAAASAAVTAALCAAAAVFATPPLPTAAPTTTEQFGRRSYSIRHSPLTFPTGDCHSLYKMPFSVWQWSTPSRPLEMMSSIT